MLMNAERRCMKVSAVLVQHRSVLSSFLKALSGASTQLQIKICVLEGLAPLQTLNVLKLISGEVLAHLFDVGRIFFYFKL